MAIVLGMKMVRGGGAVVVELEEQRLPGSALVGFGSVWRGL
jgi:hypothetical protein